MNVGEDYSNTGLDPVDIDCYTMRLLVKPKSEEKVYLVKL